MSQNKGKAESFKKVIHLIHIKFLSSKYYCLHLAKILQENDYLLCEF